MTIYTIITIIFLNVLKNFGVVRFILLKDLPSCQYVMTILIAVSISGLVFVFDFACLEGFWKGSTFVTVKPTLFTFSCHLLIKDFKEDAEREHTNFG